MGRVVCGVLPGEKACFDPLLDNLKKRMESEL